MSTVRTSCTDTKLTLGSKSLDIPLMWNEKKKESLQIQAEIIRRVSPRTMKGHLSFKKHTYCFHQNLLLQARWWDHFSVSVSLPSFPPFSSSHCQALCFHHFWNKSPTNQMIISCSALHTLVMCLGFLMMLLLWQLTKYDTALWVALLILQLPKVSCCY